MNVVEARQLSKSFGPVRAVADVSFAVGRGEIFGMLGPNGAGKTTTIRLLLDIFKPDSGSVSILDGPMTEAKKDRIGYMPEERGLYPDMTLERCLAYLGSLKGLPTSTALERTGEYLKRFDLWQHRSKKVKELSRGMQQKAQVISTVLPHPELLIVDEPFSGLDPVNTRLVNDLLLELRDEGATIIMSTHMMNKVEELCDRIVLINKGYAVLYGPLNEIRRSYASHEVSLTLLGQLPNLGGVKEVRHENGDIKLVLDDGTAPASILRQLAEHEADVLRFEVATPALEDIFIQVVRGRTESD